MKEPDLLANRLYTRVEATHWIPISPATWWRWKKRGLINVVQTNGRDRIRGAEIMRVIGAADE